MNEKNTDTLQQELMSTNNLDRFLTENDASFRDVPLQEAIQRIFDEKGMSKAQLAKQSGISEVYLHQLFSGRRFPSRSRLLCLCFGLGPRWTRRSPFCSRRATRRCTPATGGTPSSSSPSATT